MPTGTSFDVTAEWLFDGRSMRRSQRVVAENGSVVAIEPHGGVADFPVLAPGLVDIQVNGFGANDASHAAHGGLHRLDAELAAEGTTTWLATLVTDSLDRMSERIAAIEACMTSAPGCAGIHLEGPFLGSRPGAHRVDRIVDPDMEWIASLSTVVRLMTVGAESDAAFRAIRALVSRRITVALGHTAPTESQFLEAVESGANVVTHLFNAMNGVQHRDFGLALGALTEPRISFGLVADLVHVSPRAVGLAFSARPDGVILVSDSVAWDTESSRSRGVTVRDGAPRLPDGTLAGSSTPLAKCVANAINHCGVDPSSALAAATSRPALALGLEHAGHLREGAFCDMVAFDSAYSVARVWRRLPSSRDFTTDD